MSRGTDGYFVRQGVSGEAAAPIAASDIFESIESAAERSLAGGETAEKRWKTADSGLAEVRAALAAELPSGAEIILPRELPSGWGVAASGQSFPATVAFDPAANPAVVSQNGQYQVVLTDGQHLLGLEANVVGDWGETPFLPVWSSSGHAVLVFATSETVVAIRPDMRGAAVMGEPGTRGAAVELAGLLERESR